MVGTVTARVSVLPNVGSELPTDSDAAAVVCMAFVDEAVDDALHVVGLSVGQSCLRTDSEDALPVFIEERSVMSCLVWPDADICGDDRFSPGVHNRILLDCQADLDYLWMVYWEGRRGIEIGSRTGVSAWRRVLCGAARLSRLPEFPDTDCLNCFSDIGRDCVLDLNAWGTCPRVRPPECGLETFAQTPPIQQNCLIAEVPSGAVTLVRGHSPGETQDARKTRTIYSRRLLLDHQYMVGQ